MKACILIVLLLIVGCTKKTLNIAPDMITPEIIKPVEIPQPNNDDIVLDEHSFDGECKSYSGIVYYPFDSDEPSESSQGVLHAALEALCCDGGTIFILGHCCPIGTEEYNYQLGIRRASKVKDFFLNNGIGIEKISFDSRGESNLVTTDPGKYSLNRRAEIYVISYKSDLEKRNSQLPNGWKIHGKGSW